MQVEWEILELYLRGIIKGRLNHPYLAAIGNAWGVFIARVIEINKENELNKGWIAQKEFDSLTDAILWAEQQLLAAYHSEEMKNS